MIISEIISEADVLVPNAVDQAQKLVWLNAINQDFFNVVKIPKTKSVALTSGVSAYSVGSDVREKNVFRVRYGLFYYRSFNYDQNAVNTSHYTVNDDNNMISLTPAPYADGTLTVSFFRVAATTYISSNLSALPDAPIEYHWTYIPALAAYLAKTEDDATKAANFETEYKSAWNVAAQNYQQVMPS